jgi:uncharacterized membrane protein
MVVLAVSLVPGAAVAATAFPVVQGRVTAVENQPLTNVAGISQATSVLTVQLLKGPDAGKQVQANATVLDMSQRAQRFEPGDQVYLAYNPSTGSGSPTSYSVVDRVRTIPMLVLAGAFALLIVLTSRWKGLRSLIGIAVTFVVIAKLLVPRILDGQNPVAVSLVAAFLIFGVTLFLVHGIGRMTIAAVTGTTMSLMLTALLALLFVGLTQLTGLGSEEAGYLQAPLGGAKLNPQGLLLAGIIIGALGVLDDITVSQSSTVFELRKVNPALPLRRLFSSGIKVGRDHIATTVNTLVLAYVGAALPLMLLFTRTDQPFLLILNREMVTEEIVRTLVGTIGLIAAVPFTTLVASWLAMRTHPADIDELGHAHGPRVADPHRAAPGPACPDQ